MAQTYRGFFSVPKLRYTYLYKKKADPFMKYHFVSYVCCSVCLYFCLNIFLLVYCLSAYLYLLNFELLSSLVLLLAIQNTGTLFLVRK